MRYLTALDVDDGACSVVGELDIETWIPGRPTAGVIDCGSYSGSHEDAARRLAMAIGPTAALIDSIVVSHFDSDHWEGFTHLADYVSPRLPSLNVYVPHMPPRLPAGVLAFMTTRSSDGTVTSLLRDGIAPLLRTGKTPRIIPVAGGDKVTVGGIDMDVIWPPEHLPDGRMRSVANAINAVYDLADELRSKGSPGLGEAITNLTEDEPALDQQTYPHQSEVEDSEAEDDVDDTNAGIGAHVLRGFNGSPAEAEAAKKKVTRVFKRIRKANNDLSIALLSEDGSAFFLGDLGDSVLSDLLTDPLVAPRLGKVDVMLAPHHGSQLLKKATLPPARICIAQAGKSHMPRWRTNHLGRHAGGGCVCINGLSSLTVKW